MDGTLMYTMIARTVHPTIPSNRTCRPKTTSWAISAPVQSSACAGAVAMVGNCVGSGSGLWTDSLCERMLFEPVKQVIFTWQRHTSSHTKPLNTTIRMNQGRMCLEVTVPQGRRCYITGCTFISHCCCMLLVLASHGCQLGAPLRLIIYRIKEGKGSKCAGTVSQYTEHLRHAHHPAPSLQRTSQAEATLLMP